MSSLATLDVAAPPSVTGAVSVAFEYSADWTASAVAQAAEVVSVFTEAGALGGYRGVAMTPSHLQIAAGPQLRGPALVVGLSAANVDAKAFQFLRHLIGRVDFGAAAVQRIVVRTENAAGEMRMTRHPFVDDANEEDCYPPPVDPKPFQVVWSEEPWEKARRVEIELGTRVVARDIEEIARVGRVWGALLEGGAFALPFGTPDEIDSFVGEASIFDEYAIEFDVPVYQASEAGWDVLLNMLTTVTGQSLPIVGVTIE